jgi:hypothetical protein
MEAHGIGEEGEREGVKGDEEIEREGGREGGGGS